MCGIIATNSKPGSNLAIQDGLRSIKHRGPDDEGMFTSGEGDTSIGQVRLSIIDLSQAGHQPMFDGTGRYAMVYNGEVYNYDVLKAGLDQKYPGIAWKSTSDSEVILEGFVREGGAFLSKLNGIFAIIIYDQLKQELHVLRDPIGIKPLYITEQNSILYFCSELKGLLSFPNLQKTLRKQSLADQLAFMYVPEPFTMYEEYQKVQCGIHYVYSQGKQQSANPLFAHLDEPVSFSGEEDMTAQFGTVFSESVKRQLMADVPVSLLLSGGLDSSAVAYEAVKNGGNIHSAYTISFSQKDTLLDQQSPDLFYAEKMAKTLNLDLRVIQAESNFLSLLPELIPFLEDGISDPAAINTYLISKSARKDGIKVMLSGQGADEYLCGYRRYAAEKYLQGMFPPVKAALSGLYKMIPSSVPGKLNGVARRIKRFAEAAGKPEEERLPGYFMWADKNTIRNFFADKNGVAPGKDLIDFFDAHKNDNRLETMLKADQQFDLLALNLSYSDKMSMATGVELRVPFLDFEMVRLMNSVPISMKLKNGEQKYILKKAMEQRLPHEIIYRHKAGFALPIRSWFAEENPMFDQYFDEARIRKQGVFDGGAIAELYRQQKSRKKDNSYALFAILCQQIWLEQSFNV